MHCSVGVSTSGCCPFLFTIMYRCGGTIFEKISFPNKIPFPGLYWCDLKNKSLSAFVLPKFSESCPSPLLGFKTYLRNAFLRRTFILDLCRFCTIFLCSPLGSFFLRFRLSSSRFNDSRTSSSPATTDSSSIYVFLSFRPNFISI